MYITSRAKNVNDTSGCITEVKQQKRGAIISPSIKRTMFCFRTLILRGTLTDLDSQRIARATMLSEE